jgi:aryl-alcohol dehydrogenase-like predicted oxidoreductase
LRYVLSEQAVSTVIPGMRTVRNVERNTAVSDLGPLTDQERQTLARHRWEKNFYPG